jgi:hypothetical protein
MWHMHWYNYGGLVQMVVCLARYLIYSQAPAGQYLQLIRVQERGELVLQTRDCQVQYDGDQPEVRIMSSSYSNPAADEQGCFFLVGDTASRRTL